ncbi:hypothetical protein AEB_P3111 [Altererythrobacter sp. B11]|nr:hypothetical protein AEB_P3111 [Altererythrobacter sp. B11]
MQAPPWRILHREAIVFRDHQTTWASRNRPCNWCDDRQGPHRGKQPIGPPSTEIPRKSDRRLAHAPALQVNKWEFARRLLQQFAPGLHHDKFGLVTEALKLTGKRKPHPFDAPPTQVRQ